MDIQYNTNNNLCFSDSNGFIDIGVINLTESESLLFGSYTIEWFGDLTNATLSNDKRILNNLKNGTYSFRLVSLQNSSITSDLYTINITSPNQLEIKNIYSSQSSCGDNGFVQVFVKGGQSPYRYVINNISNVVLADNYKFENLEPGTYNLIVIDNNGCSVSVNDIILLESTIELVVDQIISPKHFNSMGGVSFNVSGTGPFAITFESQNDNNRINVDALDTTYLTSISNTTYNYIFNNLYPGDYNLIITDKNGCVQISEISIPNIDPISVNINVSTDTSQNIFAIHNTVPIFDTLLIPYKFIVNNTKEWQAIKKYNLKNYLPISIDGNIYEFLITRTMLNKYCLDDNKIEILRLGNTDKDWFFYLQLAPSINLNNNPEFINAKIELKNENGNIPITLGLNNFQQLDSDNISLIRGSFVVSGFVDSQFKDNTDCYISTTDQISDINEYSFITENIKVSTHRNLYAPGVVTIINFLENFKTLINTVSLHQNFCDLNISEYRYLINIKNLLITLNNFNYINNIFIYSVNKEGNGSIVCSVSNQIEFYLFDETVINEIYINYYYFNQNSKKLSDLLLNNKLAHNILSLSDIRSGFYIIRIRDKYNNIPYNIINNNKTILYDIHSTEAKQIIQIYNPNILPMFEAGDILAYVPKTNQDVILDQISSIPTISTIKLTIPSAFIPETQLSIISQTNIIENKASLTINISPILTKCIIHGPNNYLLQINENTKLINMIPGVYTIQGEEEDLFAKNLYQNYNRILVDKNSNITTSIKFESYKDKILIKE